jgi:hypothetical protein
MLNKPTIAFLAWVFALANFPAFAVDIPDYGSKNFSPTGDTPTYFTNESAPVSARTADTSATDWTAEEAAAPVPSVARRAPSAHQGSGKHGRYSPRYGRHASGRASGNHPATYVTRANTGKVTGTASAHYPGGQVRTVGKKPVWAASTRGAARAGTPTAAKTTTAKHGKASARHARAAVFDPSAATWTAARPREA